MLLTTPEEDAKVEELRAKLPETSSIRPPNDMCVRFLRARSLNVDKVCEEHHFCNFLLLPVEQYVCKQ